jgi:hypothetical protein
MYLVIRTSLCYQYAQHVSADATPDAPPETPPDAHKRKPHRLRYVAAIIVVAAVVYLGVVALYASSGRIASLSDTTAPPPPGGVTVVLTPDSVNPAAGRISMNLQIDPSKELVAREGIGLTKTVHVILSPAAGAQSITFKAGAVPSIVPVDIIVDGSIENWPFDGYRADPLVIIAYAGDGDSRALMPTHVSVHGYVPGWNLDAVGRADPPYVHINSDDAAADQSHTIAVRAWRAGSTIAFGIVLLALMIAMPCLVLFVAINAYRGKRKMEPTLMSWMAAMLFATIPLRTFLPGSPPIGSWIDYLIVLWVFAGLVAGLVIYVFAWWRWGARGERAPHAP